MEGCGSGSRDWGKRLDRPTDNNLYPGHAIVIYSPQLAIEFKLSSSGALTRPPHLDLQIGRFGINAAATSPSTPSATGDLSSTASFSKYIYLARTSTMFGISSSPITKAFRIFARHVDL